MPQPWRTVPIFGSWLRSDQSLRPGTYKIVSNAQVSSTIGDAIVLPLGLVQTGQLNTDESLSSRSFVFEAPAADDPDMLPQDFILTISVTPEGAERVVYQISPSLINEDDGINLRTAILPSAEITSFRGIPGGVAELDENGLVPLDQLPNFSVSSFVHVQSVPSASWGITHNFGRFPLVSVYVAGSEIIADVDVTATTATVTHAAPTTGVAVLV